MKMMTSIATALTLSTILTLATKMTSNMTKTWKEKWSPFECGFSQMSNQRIPFSTQFFIVSILFLIFDIEISLLFPFPTTNKSTKGAVIMLTFLTILAMGLAYEWKTSKLNWAK